MHRRGIILILLIPVVGIMSVANAFNVFNSSVKQFDTVSYCAQLDQRLQEFQSSILLVEVGLPNRIYEVVPSEESKPCAQGGYPFTDQRSLISITALQGMIQDGVVTVQSHRIVDYITLLTPEGKFLLTAERTGELEPTFVPASGGGASFGSSSGGSSASGLYDKPNLLLSFIGSAKSVSIKRQKFP